MNKTFLIIFSCLSFAIFSQTKNKKEQSIDVQESKCLKKDNISNAEMCNCSIIARQSWDKELNKYYNLLKAKLAKEKFEILKESQKHWIAYRDKEFSFISKFYYEVKEGTMWYSIAENNKTEIVKSRALELIQYYETLDY
jgi:uncharacterized protein YecT (DUF1311 family)